MKKNCKKVEAIYKLGCDGYLYYVEIKETAKKRNVQYRCKFMDPPEKHVALT